MSVGIERIALADNAHIDNAIDAECQSTDEENGFMRLELDFENGQWRVKNFDQPEAFGPGGYLKIMEDFAGEHVTSHYLLRDGETKQYVALSIQNDGTQKKLKEWQGK